jgi:hypothetical protein
VYDKIKSHDHLKPPDKGKGWVWDFVKFGIVKSCEVKSRPPKLRIHVTYQSHHQVGLNFYNSGITQLGSSCFIGYLDEQFLLENIG